MSIKVKGCEEAKASKLDLEPVGFAKAFIRKAPVVSSPPITPPVNKLIAQTHLRTELTEKAFARVHEIIRESEAHDSPNKRLVGLLRMRAEQRNPTR